MKSKDREWKGLCRYEAFSCSREILTVNLQDGLEIVLFRLSAIKQEAHSSLDDQDISSMPNSPADETDWMGISCLYETQAGSTASNRRRWIQGHPGSQ